jgi:hypothetical protein
LRKYSERVNSTRVDILVNNAGHGPAVWGHHAGELIGGGEVVKLDGDRRLLAFERLAFFEHNETGPGIAYRHCRTSDDTLEAP